jgi:hypothetical protein
VAAFNPFEGNEMHPMNFNLASGPSVQTAIEYSNHFSYLNYSQTGGKDVVINTLDEFCGFYNFPSDDQIICIPVSRELFENTNFSDEQIESALSCILFTSPSHLWSLYQLLSSESHSCLNVFSMDGTYSIRMSQSGSDKTVIMSLGFLHLDVHQEKPSSNISQMFVPSIHCLSQSESATTTYACLYGLALVYQSLFQRFLHVHCLSADNSAAIASGLGAAFPNSLLITDIEHIRVGPTKKWNSKIRGGKRMQTKLVYWLNLLYHARNPINFKNAFTILMDQLEAEGEDEISAFLSSRYGPMGSTPWNLTYNSSGRVGIIAEQQQIKGYYGLLKPNTKLGRIGAFKTNAGFSYLLKEGFSSLLKWDCERIRKLLVGSFSARFPETVKGNFTPEHIFLAMLMSDEVDLIPATM